MSNPAVILITDLDNTLYDFAAYFSPCFRAMIHALNRELGVGEDRLVEEFRTVYERHETLEYTFVVQELPIVQALPEEEVTRLGHIASVAFGRTRRRRLKLYPHVKETLFWAKRSGARISAVTNAPAYHAYRRLRDLGILGVFNTISARDGIHVPEQLSHHVRVYEDAYATLNAKMQNVQTYGSENLKPQIPMLAEAKSYWTTAEPDIEHRFISIGDNVANDLFPSSLLQMTTVWARYGTKIADRDYRTMISVTPISTRKRLAPPPESYSPDFVIDDFGALKDILPYPYQRELI